MHVAAINLNVVDSYRAARMLLSAECFFITWLIIELFSPAAAAAQYRNVADHSLHCIADT